MSMTRALSFALLAACGGATVTEVPPPQQQQAQEQPQQPTCPSGSQWNGSACVGQVDTSCPGGMTFVVGRGCVAQVVQQTPPPPPPPPPDATVANYPPPPRGMTCPPGTRWGGSACMVTRGEWIRRMNAALPPKICTLPIFQRCFRATEAECERIVASLSDACMAERTLPPLFDENLGNREGEAVGRCIGTAYEQNMRARHRVSPAAECQPSSP